MRLLLFPLIGWLVFNTGFAQSLTFTADTVWIHRLPANSEDEDLESYFPLFKCREKPQVAENINRSLQMQEFAFVLNDKRLADLRKPLHFTDESSITFSLGRMNNRVIFVDIGRFNRTSFMTLAGHYNYRRYYFDAVLGDEIALHLFFTGSGFQRMNTLVVPGLRQSFIETMQKYRSEFTAKDEAELDNECGCDCTERINNTFCADLGTAGFTTDGSFQYSIISCAWTNPGNPDDTYTATVSAQQVNPLLSAYGKYMIRGGVPVPSPTIFYKLWKGTIGEKIPISFLMKYPPCNPALIVGVEIYDKIGVRIALDGTFKDQILTLHELTPEGKSVATIEATLQSGKLKGQWKKADGSKTLAFEASPASSF